MWWLQFSLKDAIDILLLAVFLYYTYTVLKASGSKAIFTGVIAFFGLWILISHILKMQLMGALLDKFVNIGFLVLVIIFQDEMKQFLSTIGSAQKWKRFRRYFRDKRQQSADRERYIAPIVLACLNLSRKRTGALIAIQQSFDLSVYQHAGERFEADVNARLIETIFFKNSPLHDGAMIIAQGKIRAAGCILPVASNPDLNKDLGLRHRSALGLSQQTDAKVIIISEERGTISMAYRGEIMLDITAEQLQELLSKE
ncbi:diadenylate cyclase CdaA [Porphyromonas sp. COT-239 OH1446]|uniref:diadenylate cyclase CdaA n=1 Tax=Porphyromonas sp. COT-239 OH1446 TaxID=1515613 RepID=UPI00052C0DFB|nr:diadenylate cyclase CdaA [Porphyromonas sp. COT-239 OH1446]KGN70200.1 membrane protein [Porphyromonas sp. COT-239 OH1446]